MYKQLKKEGVNKQHLFHYYENAAVRGQQLPAKGS